jgi:hypothetical protein
MASVPETDDKTWNAICYFALEHERRTRRPLSDASLYDYMVLLDSGSIEKTGHPALDQAYRTHEMGSLLTRDGGKREKTITGRLVVVPRGENGYIVRATREADLHYFSTFEQAEMKRLVRTYAHEFAKTGDNGKETGEAAGIWKRIKGVGANADIKDGEDKVLPDDSFLTKKEEKVTMSNLHTLTEKYMAQVKELETQLADVRHKLEVVMEASRLLAEEGFSDDYSSNRVGANRA